MCFDSKRAELEMHRILRQHFVLCNNISIEDFSRLTKTKFMTEGNDKYLQYFKCEKCLSTTIKNFRDCVLVDEMIFSSSVNIPNKYDNCAAIGSILTEILSTLEYTLAKIELFEYLFNILSINSQVSFEFIKANLIKTSYLCCRIFSCEHSLLSAIEEIPQIFCLFKVLDNTENYVVYANGQIQELWDYFNTDYLLNMMFETYLQLSAKTQLYIYLRNFHLVCKNLIQLHETVQNISESCAIYFSTMNSLETFLLFHTDLLSAENGTLEVIKDNSKPSTYYEPLIYDLNKYFDNQYFIYKFVIDAKAFLEIQNQITLGSLQQHFMTNPHYHKHPLRKKKHKLAALSQFFWIFHMQRENITLLKNECKDKHLFRFENSKSENAIDSCMESITETLLKINVYCYLIFHASKGVTFEIVESELQTKGFKKYLKKETIFNFIKQFHELFQIKSNLIIYFNEDLINSSRKLSNNIPEIESSSKFQEENLKQQNNENEDESVLSLSSTCSLLKSSNDLNNLGQSDICESISNYQQTSDNFDRENSKKLILKEVYHESNTKNCNCKKRRLVTTFIDNGILCAVTKTVGYVQIKDDVIPIIVDVIYNDYKQVENLLDLHKKNINFIAIKSEGELIDFWKISLAWIDVKPENIPCAITSNSAWENIKFLYEKQWKEFRCS